MSLILGTNANNALSGTASCDVILAGNGADVVDGGAGCDLIDGGNGNDVIDGGAGSDVVIGGNGDDTLDGGAGCDLLTGGNGKDTLIYDAAENIGSIDLYDGGSGGDTLRLVVSASLANTAAFLADMAALMAKLSGGRSASYVFNSIGLAVTSIEAVQLVVIGGENGAPVANADSLNATEDATLVIPASSLLSNDTDPDNDSLSIVSVTSGANGTATYNPSTNQITFVPAANFSGVASFTYKIRDAAGAESTATVTIAVAAAADAPTLSVSAASGAEDGAIPLSISGALMDADGSESLSFTITGVPAGALLNHGTHNANGSWTLTTFDLAGLTITPPANFAGVINLNVAATSSETSNGSSSTVSAALAVTVAAVADAPTVSATSAAGSEDTAVALNIAGLLADTDGSESLSFVIAGVPADATLNHGVRDSNGDWTIAGTDIASLMLTPPANSKATMNLSVRALSTETSNGDTESSAPVSFQIALAPVADGPAITANSITAPNGPAPINLNLAITLLDPSETLAPTVEISNVPSSFLLSKGSPTDDGAYIVQLADIPGLQLVPRSGSPTAGTFTLHIEATSSDGAASRIAEFDLPVVIEPPVGQVMKRAIDGYIAGATVFADANGDGVLDAGEVSTVTAADGTFVLNGGVGDLVMFGGVDTSTGLDFHGVLRAAAGSTVVTPLTTLILAVAGEGGDLAAAETAVKTAFGIESDVDLASFDPVTVAADSGATEAEKAEAALILSAAIQVQTTITQISAAVAEEGAQEAVLSAVAAVVAAGGPVSLSDPLTMSEIVGHAAPTASAAAAEAIAEIVSAANNSVAEASTSGNALENMAKAATVALGATTEALVDAGLDESELAAAAEDYTEEALAELVVEAVPGDPDGAQVGTLGNDTLTGAGGADVIDGLDGDDTLDGAAGADRLYGGEGRDRLIGGAGDDFIDGGLGADRAWYANALEAITVNLAAGDVFGGASTGHDTLRAVEGVRGTGFNDVFNAAGFYASSINGGGSGITIAGGYGAQSAFNEFEGGAGDDQIIGNMDTRIVYLSATSAVNVNLATGIATGDASVGTDMLAAGTIAQVRGSNFNDTIIGRLNTGYLTESFEGWGGDDFIDGNGGFDRVRYDNQNTGALGVIVSLAAGTVTGRDAAATAVVGLDTLRSIESVRGSNAADIFNATGFVATATGAAPNAGGDQGNFNEFEGMGGDDQITGNGNTRIRYTNSTGAVTIDMSASAPGAGAGTATGNGSVGTDTFTGVNALRGSFFNDTLIGSNNGNNTTENFEGWGGDDLINGGLGFDRARYDVNNLSPAESLTLGVNIQMTAGVVTGRDALATTIYGSDTLRKIESVRGTNAGDIYVATSFGAPGSIDPNNNNVGDIGTFNEFEGMGGSDTVTGNGNTRITFVAASESVTVNLATGSVVGGASVGTDSITGGVNQVRGSGFNDDITGSALSDTLDGQGGDDILNGGDGNDSLIGNAGADTLNGGGDNDTINGGVGNDAINGGGGIDIAQFNALRSAVAANVSPTVGSVTTGSDGTDTLTDVELLRFNDGLVLASSALNLTNFNGFPVTSLFGRNIVESLTIGQQLNGGSIDLGGGADTLTLGLGAGGTYSLMLSNVETVVGSGGNDILTLQVFGQTGASINLGGGVDTLAFNGSINVASVLNVEFLTGAGGDDTITFTQTANAAVPAAIDLGSGNDALTLTNNGVSGNNVNVANAETINGSTTDDQVTIVGSAFAPPFITTAVDLGSGVNTLTLAAAGFVTHQLTIANVQTVNSTAGDGETVNLGAAVNGVTVDLGAGFDQLNLNFFGGSNSLSVANVETLNGSDSDDTIAYAANTGSNNQINLYGGSNILNLSSGGATTFSISVNGASLTINGQNGVSESITMNNTQFGTSFDLGTGGDDSLSLLISSTNSVSVANAEHITGGNFSDSIIVLGNSTGATEVMASGGADFITASGDVELFRFASIADSSAGVGRDQITGFDADEDQFLFSNSIGFAGGSITYVGDLGEGGTLSSTGNAQSALINFGGQTVLLVDANGDGVAEIEAQLIGRVGTLDSGDFVIG